MSPTPETTPTTIILANHNTWQDWNEQCLTQAYTYRLLDYIQGNGSLLTDPLRPNMADYPRVQKPQARSARTTRSHSRAVGDGTETVVGEDDVPTDSIPTIETVGFNDLSIEGQKSFQVAWNFYQDDLKLFDKQQERVTKMRNWIIAHVSTHFQKTCCKAAQSLPQWYTNLQKAAGISKRQQDANALQKYKDAVKPPKPKDLAAWADKWEQTMTEAKEKDVLATKRASQWFEDFLGAVRTVKPTWAEAYGINKDSHIEDDTLDFHTVANDLRKVASQSLYAKSARFANGSFGPTFAGEEGQHGRSECTEDTTEDIKRMTSIKRKKDKSRSGTGKQVDNSMMKEQDHLDERARSSTASRKRKASTGENGKACRACDGIHLTQKCFYLFPNKAPEGWKPRSYTQEQVKATLEDDPILKEEYKRWKKEKDNQDDE